MYIIRKISPWQTPFSSNNFFYPIGNPAVFASNDKAATLHEKKELELIAIMENPLSNFFEYWDIDSSKELIELNDFLVKNHDLSILTTNNKKVGDEVTILEVIPDIYFDNRFSEADMLKVQAFVGRYYYGFQELKEVDKYILVSDSPPTEAFSSYFEFKIYDTEAAAKADTLLYPNDTILVKKIE